MGPPKLKRNLAWRGGASLAGLRLPKSPRGHFPKGALAVH